MHSTCRILLSQQQYLWEHLQALDGGRLDWLSVSEQLRLATLHQPTRRQEFIACRWALRQVLSMHATQVTEWQLGCDAGQPPNIQISPLHALCADWHLSLTHSGTEIACAAAPSPVGIDIELLAPRRQRSPVLEAASLVCAPSELRQIQSLPTEAAQRTSLLRYWSLKEAFFKYARTGLNWVQLPKITCTHVTNNQMVPATAIAYARVWESQSAVLAVCSQQVMTKYLFATQYADTIWNSVTDWYFISETTSVS